jgi:serine/threonine protein kinase
MEALVWRELKHPNVLEFLGVSSKTHLGFVSLVSPWMDSGTLTDYISVHADADRLWLVCASRTRYKMAILNNFARLQIGGIASGLSYLHHREPPVVHGDLRGVSTPHLLSRILLDGILTTLSTGKRVDIILWAAKAIRLWIG